MFHISILSLKRKELETQHFKRTYSKTIHLLDFDLKHGFNSYPCPSEVLY